MSTNRAVAGQLSGTPATVSPSSQDNLTSAYRIIFAAAARDQAMSIWLPRLWQRLCASKASAGQDGATC